MLGDVRITIIAPSDPRRFAFAMQLVYAAVARVRLVNLFVESARMFLLPPLNNNPQIPSQSLFVHEVEDMHSIQLVTGDDTTLEVDGRPTSYDCLINFSEHVSLENRSGTVLDLSNTCIVKGSEDDISGESSGETSPRVLPCDDDDSSDVADTARDLSYVVRQVIAAWERSSKNEPLAVGDVIQSFTQVSPKLTARKFFVAVGVAIVIHLVSQMTWGAARILARVHQQQRQ
jgi:hypothetical protein